MAVGIWIWSVLAVLQSPAAVPQDIVAGTGRTVQQGDVVVVHLVAEAPDGRAIADTRKRGLPFAFQVAAGGVEPWLDGCVRGMRVGGVRKVVLDPSSGYGEEGVPPVVPPAATLTVTVTLLEARPVQSGR
ncbi:MAG: FKBP-type peptidyl-prolyl cis-trans isomerase [Fimbriimonadaceae bacterium]